MQLKKSPKADLEHWRTAALLLGITFATALVLCAFEWRTPIIERAWNHDFTHTYLPDEVILASFPEKPKPPTAPPPKAIRVADLIAFQPTDFGDFPAIDPITDDGPIIENIPNRVETFEEDFIMIPDVQAEFPGGMEALMNYLSSNLKYPAMARNANISGKVYLRFTVDKTGKISDVEVLRGLGGGLEQEAVRVVKSMPDWTPAKHRGKAAKVIYTLPVNFVLAN